MCILYYNCIYDTNQLLLEATSYFLEKNYFGIKCFLQKGTMNIYLLRDDIVEVKYGPGEIVYLLVWLLIYLLALKQFQFFIDTLYPFSCHHFMACGHRVNAIPYPIISRCFFQRFIKGILKFYINSIKLK